MNGAFEKENGQRLKTPWASILFSQNTSVSRVVKKTYMAEIFTEKTIQDKTKILLTFDDHGDVLRNAELLSCWTIELSHSIKLSD